MIIGETKLDDSYPMFQFLIEETCYKAQIHPSCIDLFLTNSRNSFKRFADLASNLRANVQDKTNFLKFQSTFLSVLEKHALSKSEMLVLMKYPI